MITEDRILIERPLEEVYSMASDIERQHEFIPGYKPARIVEKMDDGRMVVERTALVDGKELKWTSLADFSNKNSILFEQLEGKLKGMKIDWIFEEVPEGTRITIRHDFHLDIPIIGRLAERYIAKPKVDKITRSVLEGLRQKLDFKKL